MNIHREQRGIALGLVLIFLTVGSLMISPAISYTITALQSERISERKLVEQDTVDSAVMDAIWQVMNEAVLQQVNEEGQYAYDFELEMERWGITIEIPSFAGSEWQQVRGNNYCKIEVCPNWLWALEEETFYYILRLDMIQWDLSQIVFTLPEGLTFDTGTAATAGPESQAFLEPNSAIDYENYKYWHEKKPKDWLDFVYNVEEVDVVPEPPDPDTRYLIKTWEEGRQKLTWHFNFSDTGNDTFFLLFQATGTLSWGIHSVAPHFGDGVDFITMGPTASIASAIYNIFIDFGEQTISAIVALTGEGDPKLISYHLID
jgi:hypothetical protein